MNISINSARTIRQIFAAIAVFAMVFSPFANVQFASAASALPNGGVSLQQWSDVSNSWQNGNLNDGSANYSEGEVVPFELKIDSNSINLGQQYSFSICRNYENGTKKGYLSIEPYNTDRAAVPSATITSNLSPISAGGAVVDSVVEVLGQGACNSGDRETQVTITINAQPAYILWGGYLASPTDAGVGSGNSASQFPGGSLHMTLLSPNKDRSIQTDAIIPVVTGCTDPAAVNYNLSADEDDGSCSYSPKLTVTKVVLNNSGTGSLDVVDFPLFVGTTSVTSGVQSTFTAGAYVVSETGDAGYTASFSGDCDANGNIVLANDGIYTCTITNDDIEPDRATITVVKSVVNDNGGTLGVVDFPLFVGTTSVTSGVALEVFSAGNYVISETNQYGYAAGEWGEDCNPDGSLTGVVLGGSYTCTITNDDIAPKLTVTKVVLNNSGTGSLDVVDFPLFVGTTSVTSGVQSTFTAGAYVVSETGDAGYTASFSGDCDANGNVTLSAGDVKSCTITNDDNPPTSAVVSFFKSVINAFGDNALPTDFSFNLTNYIGTIFHGDSLDLEEGTYDISENLPDNGEGYTVSYEGACTDGTLVIDENDLGTSLSCTVVNTELPQCSNGIDDDNDGYTDFDGQDVGCENDGDDSETDPVGTITIDKVVTGEGASDTEAFTFDASGPQDFDADFILAGTSTPEVLTDLAPGTYTITELDSDDHDRWNLADISCEGIGQGLISTSSDAVMINLPLGGDVDCTFTNHYTPRDSGGNSENIVIVKEVTDGSDTDDIFGFAVEGENIDETFSLSAGLSHDTGDLTANEWYTITETDLPSGWDLEDVSCESDQIAEKEFAMDEEETDLQIYLNDGEEIICTFTNDQDRYDLSGQVWHDADEDGVIDEGESILPGWIVRVTNGEGTNLFTETDAEGFYHFNVPEGTWTITEDLQGGWNQTSPVANSGAHIVTFPEVEEEMTLLDSMFNFILPTAHAAVMGGANGLNFGNVPQPSYSQGSYGGGNGRSITLRDDDDDDEPEGQVLGEATSTMPVGAPNTGKGGSASFEVHALAAILASRRSVRANAK